MARNEDNAGTSLGPCPLCGRPMIDGPSVDRHHWIPRSEGGRVAAPLHRVCHRMLHRLFSHSELAQIYRTPDAVRGHPDMARFINWVRRQPVDYVDWPKAPRHREPR